MRLAWCFFVALLAGPSLASAQGRFWLVDAADQFIGEVASVDLAHAWVAITAPDGEPIFTPISGGGAEQELHVAVYFESANCTGPGYVATTYAQQPALRTGYWVTGQWLWATKRTLSVTISAQAKYEEGNFCAFLGSPTPVVGREVEEIGMVLFTPPYRVIRNPNTLLLDGFELGNSSHWSASTPPGAAPRPKKVSQSADRPLPSSGSATPVQGERR